MITQVNQLLDSETPGTNDRLRVVPARRLVALRELTAKASAFLAGEPEGLDPKRLTVLDVPSESLNGNWTFVKRLPRDEAIELLKREYQADSEGYVCLLTEDD